MPPPDRDRLVTAWISYQHRFKESPTEDDPEQWAFDELSDLAWDDPEECWLVILAILERDHSDRIMEMLAVPFLIERLNNEQSEFTQQHIIYVFQMMAESHSWGVEHDLYIEYDVKSDQKVVSLVEELVSSMQEPLPRQRGEESLDVILGR